MQDTIFGFESIDALRLGIFCVYAACATYLSWLGIRSCGIGLRRTVLMAYRSANILMVGSLIFSPSLQHRQLEPLKTRLVFMLDESQSMGIESKEARRIDRVRTFFDLHQADLEMLKKKHRIEIYAFSDRLRSITEDEINQAPMGERTDFAKSIQELSDLAAKEQGSMASVVLISDGADRPGQTVGGQVRGLSRELAGALDGLKLPINPWLVEDSRGYKDIFIQYLEVQEFAFIRNAVELECGIASRGFSMPVEIPVSVEQAGRTIASENVSIPAGKTTRVKIRFVPDSVGKFAYRLRLPVISAEADHGNNQRGFSLRIIRDKIRVLHVVGRPSWDPRFLREILKNDPNVDLVSFYILRNVSDTPGVTDQELSLIPFPVDKLFGSEIETFDVVVFQNFDFAPYRVGRYLQKLADYVQNGGAFCMLGGDLSFASGGYAHTGLSNILPVQLLSSDDYELEEYRPVLSAGMLHHPIMRVDNPQVWQTLPPLGSYHKIGALHPDAVVLLEHPFEKVQQRLAPILAVRQVGRGRSAVVLTDGIWRWAYHHVLQGGDSRFYYQFWSNLLRWLVRDPDFAPLMLRAKKNRYHHLESVKLELISHGMPAGDDSSQKGRVVVRDVQNRKIIHVEQYELGKARSIELEMPALDLGAYVAELEMESGSFQDTVKEYFFVEPAGPELDASAPRPALMKKIATFSGGRFQRLEDAGFDKLIIPDTQYARVDSVTNEPLLTQVWFLVGMVLMLGFEWWLRRYWGYV